jgi:hypothetical protein
MDLFDKNYIHDSWKKLNLKNIFIHYESIIKKLISIEINYTPKEEINILSFLSSDITNVKIIYLRYNRINEEFTNNELYILKDYINNKEILSLSYNLTTQENKENNLWIPLLKEVFLLLSDRIIFIHIEKNKMLNRNLYNDICPESIMRYDHILKKDTCIFYNMIKKLFLFKNKNNL